MPEEAEKGAGDHDQPYEYVRPTCASHMPFTEMQFVHLLLMRARLGDFRHLLRFRGTTMEDQH